MALIRCNECGQMISDKAKRCPKCGCQMLGIERNLYNQKVMNNSQVKNKSNNNTLFYVICGVLLTAFLGIGAYLLLRSTGDNVTNNSTDNATNTVNDNSTNNTPQKLQVTNVEYGYCLAPQAGNTYYGKNMCDGNPATAWAVRLRNNASFTGPVFSVRCKKLSHIIIRNGYCKNYNTFNNNTRAAWVRFDVVGGGLLFNGGLEDSQEPQRLDIPSDLEANNNITQISIGFTGSFYHGAKWNDLCISEVEFWGYE